MTLRLDDGCTFVEVVSGPHLPDPLPSLAAFRRFRAGLAERCDLQEMAAATVSGAYRTGEWFLSGL
ncbi:hypothetical protein [Micromonospora yangpuensis]|uniref:Uncharacterized protein n=1 Tax=Micromonospora yangpuensis TaxID=683228 RepID=A0A1C6UHP9_9ACTN|nr:hypothetical protein [Micromonospora yangpuensis]GGM03732.1 hypothetical protein GCM10012279_21840 [Micromonospora yangpuensis]SCL53586.1 hypothetical protein GA0070617_2408 [Micromonospora yangpuensis]